MPTMTPEEEIAFYKKYNVPMPGAAPAAPPQQAMPAPAPAAAPQRAPAAPMASQGYWADMLRKRERAAGM